MRITFLVEPNPILNQVTVETVPANAETRVLPPEIVEETLAIAMSKFSISESYKMGLNN